MVIPQKLSFTDSGNELWEYDYVKAHAKVQNYTGREPVFARHYGQMNSLVIFFDKTGIVQDFIMNSSDMDTHVGLFQ